MKSFEGEEYCTQGELSELLGVREKVVKNFCRKGYVTFHEAGIDPKKVKLDLYTPPDSDSIYIKKKSIDDLISHHKESSEHLQNRG